MRVQYCDHYLPVNSADPSLKNFRAAIVVLRWTCYVLSRSFSSAFLAWPCHVTKITLRTFLAWLCHMIKILRCARAWQKLPSWARGTKFQLLVFCNVMLHRSKMSSLFSYWRVRKKLPDPTGPFTVGCTDYMSAAENESGGGENAGSFIRFFYPVDKTAGPIDESKYCFWMPREEYTTGLLKFMKLPVWLLSQFFYWTVGELSFEYLTLSPNRKCRKWKSPGKEFLTN